MKNIEATLKEKTPTAIYAIASSVLTDLIVGFLGGTNYTGLYCNGKLEIISQSTFSTWQIIALSIVIFGLLWVCFCVIVPIVISWVIRLSYRPFRKYRRVEIVSTYNSVKANIMKIADTMSSQSAVYQNQNTFLFVELIKITKRLTDVFITTKDGHDRLKRSYFRRCVTIDDVERYITPYELVVLITLMQTLLQETYSSCPDEIKGKADYDEANTRLETLRKHYCEN